MFQIRRVCAALAAVGLAWALAGCGGGGDGESSATPGQAQGNYAGNFSTTAFPNGIFSSLVLEDDQIWTLYGTAGSSGELLVYGFIHGQGVASNGKFTANAMKDYFYDGTTINASLQATYQAGVSFNGTVTENGTSVTFAGASARSSYVYGTPASLNDIVGSWSGTNIAGVTSDFTISQLGTFSGLNQFGCGFSGTISPRASGKNVFDVTLQNNTSVECGSVSGLQGTGVAASAPLGGGQRQLTIAIITNDRSRGSAVFAVR